MKNKYNINIIVPILNKNFELIIPNNIKVGNILYLVIESLNKLENNNYKLQNLQVYNSLNGKIIDLNEYVFNSSIKNGSTIILA